MGNLFDKRKQSMENEYFQKATNSYQQQAQVAHSFGLEVAEWLSYDAEKTEAYSHEMLDLFMQKGNLNVLVEKAQKDLSGNNIEKSEAELEKVLEELKTL